MRCHETSPSNSAGRSPPLLDESNLLDWGTGRASAAPMPCALSRARLRAVTVLGNSSARPPCALSASPSSSSPHRGHPVVRSHAR
eukprot:9489293-Pyramimonas_sp.AAC.1